METKNIIFYFEKISVSVEFTKNEETNKWISNNQGYATITNNENINKVSCYIPSISFSDLGIKKIIEYKEKAKDKIGRLRLFLENIESNLNHKLIDFYKTNGNNFANNNICEFTMIINDNDFVFRAEFFPELGEWVVSNDELGIKISGGDGNSFNSPDELYCSFSSFFANMIHNY